MMVNDVSFISVFASPKPSCSVDSLYDDVLLSIFFHFHQVCLAGHDGAAYNSLFITRGSPWVLSHVCQRWRILIISAPLLWTTIHLDIDTYNYDPFSSALALEVVLQRSRDLELDVRIQDAQLWSSDFEQIDHSLLHLLVSTTARWRHLKIISSRAGLESWAGCSKFERLRSLDVSRCWNVDEDKAAVILFRHATKLVELTLGCHEGIDVDLPWAGIHTFSTGCSGLHSLPRMLGLQELHINVACGSANALDEATSRWDQEGTQFFELPSLRTITVREGTTNRVIHDLSKRLRVPSPKTLILHIRKSGWIGPFPPSPFPVFANLHSLVNLSIDFIEFTTNDTISFLTRTSSVINLYLGPHVATLSVMEAIGFGVVPMLKTLGLHFSAWQKGAEDIMAMLRRRDTPIPAIVFAGFGPSDDSPSSREREGHRVHTRLAESWARVRGITDVRFVERYSFEK